MRSVMSITLQLEFSDGDLEYFRKILAREQERSADLDTETIISKVRTALDSVDLDKVSGFVKRRIGQLRALVEMLEEEDWPLEEQERRDVASALAYFYRSEDVVPDSVPVLGLVDDAIIAELVLGEMQDEINAYREYCEFRASARQHGGENVSREDWYKARKHEIFERMRNRLERRQRTPGTSGKLTAFSLS